MNWTSTKTIFIFAFLFLNIFLGYQLWEKQTNHIEFAHIYESSLEELLNVKHIQIETEFSLEQPEMAQLNTTFLKPNINEIDLFENQRTLVNSEGMIESAFITPYVQEDNESFDIDQFEEDVLEKSIVRGYDYVLHSINDQQITYMQIYNDYPIFIGKLTFYFNNEGEIEHYNQIYFDVINQATSRPIISSYTILRNLIDHQTIPSHSLIRDIKLGYYGQLYEAERHVLSPSWRIVYEHEENVHIIYVNALTGIVE